MLNTIFSRASQTESVEWSKEHSFKCSCPHLCQWASCHHGLLCSSVFDGVLVVPAQYLWLDLHSRGKRRRPRRGVQGEDEDSEGELLGVVIRYSSPRVILCKRLQPSSRLGIQKMILTR